ncbi:MAG TPA: NADH-quinone oxidoreductase subunit NuoH [Pirellulales bacterium]|jgi:NADH-quinone oxidoreductase subunit H|nr:NADH-quinone oxidoreductase subunit NuoH [Pirellulales bacterium]
MSFATIEAIVKIVLLLGGLMTAAAYFVLLERWIAAWVQDRKGPNRVGIPLTKIKMFGLGQPLADGLKFIFKEEYTPAHVDKVLYGVAPIVILTAALAIFAVIPFGSLLPPINIAGQTRTIELVVAPNMDVGMIFVFALSSIAVYGVILGGWASNDKYSFLGGLRSSAQLIAYELPLGLGIIGVVLLAGSLRLDTIIQDQARTGIWNVFVQPLGFVVFLVASFAEAARLPFDLPECEQELVGGYHTEYAGMRLLLFLIAEFLHMITASFLIAILFFGGWHFWGLTGSPDAPVTWVTAILRLAVLGAKVFSIIVFFMLVRWSWPRFRFDQLMNLAWKVMLPLGLVNLAATAALVEYRAQTGWDSHPWLSIAYGWIVAIIAWVLAALFSPLSSDNRPRHEMAKFDAERLLSQ